MHHKRALKVLIATAVLDITLGIWFGYADHIGIANGVYFATVTATTAGYGDIVPHGWLAHMITVMMMITVIPLFGATFSFFTTGLTADHIDERHDELKKHLGSGHG